MTFAILATSASEAASTVIDASNVGKNIIDFCYIVAAILFILGIKLLGSQTTARKGNLISAVGLLLAVVVTLCNQGMEYQWIVLGLAIGTVVGAVLALRVQMTAMPEMVALFNGFGGMAALLISWTEYSWMRQQISADIENAEWGLATAFPAVVAVIVGGMTFSGSMIAYAKLSEKLSGKPFLFAGQKIINAVFMLATLAACAAFAIWPTEPTMFYIFLAVAMASLVLGVLFVLPIGGADMPVVISLLNSYSGIAVSAAGFIIGNTVLVVSGALVGASGLILTYLMCKAMNRSLANVLFGGVGAGSGGTGASLQGEPKPISAEDTFYLLEAARSIIIVPGYGMAVAQAQHVVKELAELLENNGAEIKFAIHAVAGRMPGHMNVLLAEADVPYEQLAETDDVNPLMPSVDVALVIGANDVVNPAAREDKTSPLYGMPIINVDQARTVIVMKRSMKAGFAGVDNPLFIAPNTRMLFGDAKQTLQAIVSEFKAAEK